MAPYLGQDSTISSNDDALPLPAFTKAFPHFYKDLESLPNSIDPFTVNATTGFLPTKLPVKDLPNAFEPLQKIVQDMPVLKLDGTSGLLATYQLGPLIDSGKALPDLTAQIDDFIVPSTGKHDLHIVTALFRDYSFLASSYLLEPCWQTWNDRRAAIKKSAPTTKKPATGACPQTPESSPEYGFGRSTLPACIARPLVKLADILSIPPFMSYAASYALYNYYLQDPSKGHEDYSNLRLIRAFERGLDPPSSEAGFILTHIHMVALTGPLLKGVIEVLESIDAIRKSPSPNTPTEQSTHIKEALHLILSTMSRIESSMERMWANSAPKDYPTYRTFIFGITNQPLFPHGVIYEGCFDNTPQNFRGESGANDSIIPLLDNLCQVPMPKNPLTSILREFRGYRPESQRCILSWTESKATELNTREYFTNAASEITVLYLRVLDHIRSFRWRHWMFVREYIIKRSKYPVATGGSPIVTWLPNQLGAVLELMESVYRDSGLQALVAEGQFHGGGLSAGDGKMVKDIMGVVEEQKVKLEKEVRKYCEERGV
ncbi:hypothetical protein PMZ80_009260 [Knufia obscura]|uniref:Indoleamine 2,3-dioxygenase n=2 Tax=Knufia TaxID=430999 RepID=A0AAN8E8Q0_9EURO|nr:hypothetical protein PMZ80_009260 [Knufia obscura]KAK5948999.1 hypothetical protein OHC33_009920 [Knufia fluminis]